MTNMTNMISIVAGESVGLAQNNIVITKGDEIKPCEIRGHMLYVRKCKREAEMSGILIPEKSRNDTVFAVVLAVGTECGKKLSVSDRKKYDVHGSGVVLGVKVYDKILCPDDHPFGITRSPWADNEYFVHECIVKSVMENEDV